MRQWTSCTAALVASAAFLACSALPALAEVRQHETRQVLNPTAASNTCLLTAMAYSVATDLQKSSQRNYRDVTGTSLSFAQGSESCVEVSFTSEAATTPNELLLAQAVLDGSTVCIPGGNVFASDSPSNDLADHAMNYICPDVTAGSHTVKVQFRSRFGGAVALDYRTVIVRYAQ